MAKTPAWADKTKQSKFCTKCGRVVPLSGFYTTGKKVDGAPKYNSWCKQCIAQKQAAYHQKTWGPEQLTFVAHKRTKSVRSYLAYLRGKAAQRKKSSEVLSLEELELLWATQRGRCALTGWLMTMELASGVVPTNCSLDRIDPNRGYEPGNVQLVCRAANIAKSNLSQLEFFKLCRAVMENQNAENTCLAA